MGKMVSSSFLNYYEFSLHQTYKYRHKISKFEFRSYLTSHFGVMCPWAVKKNDVSSFSQTLLIGSLSNLQVMRTGIKAQMSSNLSWIRLFTLELFTLERWNFFPWTYNGGNDVSTFSHLLWIQSSSNLQVTRTGIKSLTSLNYSQIWSIILELCALKWKKKKMFIFTHISSDLLATRTYIKSQWSSYFSWIGTAGFAVMCPWVPKNFLTAYFCYAETGFGFSSSSFNSSTKGIWSFKLYLYLELTVPQVSDCCPLGWLVFILICFYRNSCMQTV